jgi:MoaA/NifB/PqqE/SkfB family radical SAM enzyme
MTSKVLIRTIRNLVFRKRPYFAHLALTHMCNLRCDFCQIPEERVKEYDTAGIKRIIDKLDRMGIACVSISGGGEPLLRPDFATIINYAADKGLYVKITSNGTMSRAKYAELLASRVSDIGISLDGVRGNELPRAHVGPKVLESIAFLHDNLPSGKQLLLNITISESNEDQVDEIVAYCTQEFPKARLWLNPVVVGAGKLRVATERKVDPGFMRRVTSPTLLNPAFYRKGCADYFRAETYNWGCLAGEMFFDIKPNGDFWICQDHPAKTALNILDDDFARKYHQADFSHRRACSGCTYFCYWVVQKLFEPLSWKDLGEMWWKRHTLPNEPFHHTVAAYGRLAGFAHFCASRTMDLLRRSVRSGIERRGPAAPVKVRSSQKGGSL